LSGWQLWDTSGQGTKNFFQFLTSRKVILLADDLTCQPSDEESSQHQHDWSISMNHPLRPTKDLRHPRLGLCHAEQIVELILRKYGIDCDDGGIQRQKAATSRIDSRLELVGDQPRRLSQFESDEDESSTSKTTNPAVPVFGGPTSQMTFCWD